MSEIDEWGPSPEEIASRAEAYREYASWKPAKTLPVRVELEERLGHIKSTWYEWRCTAFFADGTSREGTIQGDEHSQAFETFEPD